MAWTVSRKVRLPAGARNPAPRGDVAGGDRNRSGDASRGRSQSRPSASAGTLTIPCKYRAQGNCLKGRGCNYSHSTKPGAGGRGDALPAPGNDRARSSDKEEKNNTQASEDAFSSCRRRGGRMAEGHPADPRRPQRPFWSGRERPHPPQERQHRHLLRLPLNAAHRSGWSIQAPPMTWSAPGI